MKLLSRGDPDFMQTEINSVLVIQTDILFIHTEFCSSKADFFCLIEVVILPLVSLKFSVVSHILLFFQK